MMLEGGLFGEIVKLLTFFPQAENSINRFFSIFMPPNSNKLRGHIGLGLSDNASTTCPCMTENYII